MIKKIDLNSLRDRAYKTACEHGFHDTELSNEHWLCLVISELMEAVEADRKLKYANQKVFGEIIKLPHRDYASKEEIWSSNFEMYIKDTIEGELSDAAIRILDWYGVRNIEIDNSCFKDEVLEKYSMIYKNKTFTESVFNITKSLTDRDTGIAFFKIFGLARHLDIDLMWHIEQKMKYNEARPVMHGKKY